MIKYRRIVALVLCVGLSQTACYNSYFISKNELQKLESSVEQKDTVTVFGDCPEGYEPTPAAEEDSQAQAYRSLKGPLYAQAETDAETASDAVAAETVEEVATPDGAVEEEVTVGAAPESADAEEVEEVAVGAAPESAASANGGCTAVEVSTNNPLVIVTNSGEDLRVTPFNFIMSGKQIVSPEYDLLENLSDVKGAEVDEFSTWKTVGLIVGVTAAAVGTFVGISLLAGGDSADK